jgi:DNA-binding NtrC family response regulator
MAATNQDLDAAMGSGQFRADLFYRLSVVTLTVPPLRERREDIVPLVENYMAEYRKQLGRSDIEGIEENALDRMRTYGWPGNVRELINAVERAVLLCDGDVIGLEHLPEALVPKQLAGRSRSWTGELGAIAEHILSGTLEEGKRKLLEDFERDYLVHTLRRTHGNIGKTAQIAGVDPRTIYNKMKLYELRKESFRKVQKPSSE